MGYNTALMVRNDALAQIEGDPDFGKKLVAAIRERQVAGRPVEVPASGHANAAQVIETYHADQTAVVTIGGNHGVVQFVAHGWRHTEDSFKRELVRQWAAELGMQVVDGSSAT